MSATDPPVDPDATTGSAPGPPRQVVAWGEQPDFPAGYEPFEELGRGGIGVVFRARETALGRDVAVKLLLPGFPTGSPTADRFVGEARIAAQLQHPGIPPVHAVGTLPSGRPFIVMKLVRGKTLKELVDEGCDPCRYVAAFEGVAHAVAYAHERGVVHRDLKPANVMVGRFGEVQVMDWGLAKVWSAADPEGGPEQPVSHAPGDGQETAPGAVYGTPAFMPPEQAGGGGGRVGPAADVFALGGLLCYGLTGHPVYAGATAYEARDQAARGQTGAALARLNRCGADPELIDLARRCLAADPADRPAHAGEVAVGVAGWRAAAEDRARRAERERAARDQAERMYQTALTTFNRTVFGVQGRLEARAGTTDIQRELIAAARAGLDAILRAGPPGAGGGAGAARLAPADVDEQVPLADQLDRYGDQLAALGQTAEARESYEKSLALRGAGDDPAGAVGCHQRLAVLELGAGDPGRARRHCEAALALVAAAPADPRFAGAGRTLSTLLELCAPAG